MPALRTSTSRTQKLVRIRFRGLMTSIAELEALLHGVAINAQIK